ncbi:MAG TPA: ABC transporter permease [Gaiellaceae bacterium]|jgi:lipooligosaccharide transport system permease protein
MTAVLALWRPPPVWLPGTVQMWKRDALLYKRSWKRNVLPNFFEPLLYLLSIGLGLGVYVGQKILGVDYADYIAPGLAAAAAMNGAVFETTFNVFVKLRFAKLYDAVITTPLEPEDVAAGELLWAVTRSVIYGTAFLIVMAVLGYVHYWAVIFAPAAAALVGLSFGLIGLVFTSLTPTIDLFSYFFTLFITPLFLFSGIFFPVSRLGSAAFVAWFSPLYHGAELMRGLILTGDLGWAAAHALWLVVFSALVFPPAINLMRRRLVT